MHWCHKQILLPADEDEKLLSDFMCPIPELSDPATISCLFFAGSNHRRMRVQVAITQGKRAQKGNEEMQK